MNISTKKYLLRFVAVLLAIVLCLSSTGTLSLAEETDKLSESVEEVTQLAEADRPEVVSLEAVESNGHVERLRELEEDLYTVVFQNSDGSNTMYTFTEAVKYVDETGEICDKSSDIVDSID